MPNYKNNVASRKSDVTQTSFVENGNFVTERHATVTHREQVPSTSRPMLTSGGQGGGGGGRPQFETYTRTDHYQHRTEVPIQSQANYSSGGNNSGQMVSYQGQGGGAVEGAKETYRTTSYERWSSGPNGGGQGKGGRRNY